ncbi:MAG: hypothetical protein HY300_13425 [Verrucomicrobia bacterium]|nr:hypothetical protein [Verrucomicrobiota bacterium]
MRIYIESTIPSYVVARPARDLLQAARQQMTKDWWDLKRLNHELFTSQIVLDEIAEGERTMAGRRLKVMSGIPVLDLTNGAAALTRRILDSGLVPAKARAHCPRNDPSHGYIADVELPAYRQCGNPSPVAAARRSGRLRTADDLHDG